MNTNSHLLVEYREDAECGGGVSAEDDVQEHFGSLHDLVVDAFSDGSERLALIHLVLKHVVPLDAELEQRRDGVDGETEHCASIIIIIIIIISAVFTKVRFPAIHMQRKVSRKQRKAQKPMAALHQGAPGQTTWLEDPPPWLRPTYCFASVIV